MANKLVNRETTTLLDNVDEQHYERIFHFINSLGVIGSKKKFNTLEYFENELMTADVKKFRELGLPEKDVEKANKIRQLMLHFVVKSKEIRRDQWKNANDPTKEDKTFEAKKHTVAESIVNRNERLVKYLGVNPEVAREYGVALSVEDLDKVRKEQRGNLERLFKLAKKDPAFNGFYSIIEPVRQLGNPTKGVKETLYSVYKELNDNGENNRFNLKGASLKAAKKLLEETIQTRRNNFTNQHDVSGEKIEQEQRDLGL